MNTALAKADGLIAGSRGKTWRDIEVTDRDKLRRVLMLKHGSLTHAAETLVLSFNRLNGALSGRETFLYVISAIQSDLGLTDNQVLELWPLLKSWPRKSRVAC